MSELLLAQSTSTVEPKVRIVSQSFCSWKVQVLFEQKNLSANEISRQLKEIKSELARQFAVPDALLSYGGLAGKKVTRNGLLVTIVITKQTTLSHAPRFNTLPLRADDGSTFSDMIVEADLYPYDEFDNPLSAENVVARLASSGYDPEAIQWGVLREAVSRMAQSEQPILGLHIAAGTLPSLGQSSRISYGIRTDQEVYAQSAWIGVRPVNSGDFIIEISPAMSGHKWGKNLFGRELEPRQGLDVKLEPGNGAKLILHGHKLVATEDGLLVFERVGRDKRDFDAYDMIPVKVIAHVLPMITVSDFPDKKLILDQAACIIGTIPPGTVIRAQSSLLIDSPLAECEIYCAGTVRALKSVQKSKISTRAHACFHDDVTDSDIKAERTLIIGKIASNCILSARDVVGWEIHGGQVNALRQPAVEHVLGGGDGAVVIRINLRKFLEHQQEAGCKALEELRASLNMIVDIFGPQTTLQAGESNQRRLLLNWLKEQKRRYGINYTHAEVQEFRTILEMVPLIRDQLAEIGVELRDITMQLAESTLPENDPLPD
jgi:hypothetical protein